MGKGKVRQIVASTINHLFVLVGGAAYYWFGPITIRLTEDPTLNLTSEDMSWTISVIEAGATISPFVSGELTNRIGRKYVIMSIGPLCLAGWILILFSKSFLSLMIAKTFHGLATGVAFTIPPIYTAEVAEPKHRGRLSGYFQVFWYLGALYVFTLGPYLNYDNFVYVCLPVPIICTIMWFFMPETPYYLLIKNKEDEARKILKYFRDGDVEEELEDMKKAIREETSTEGSWKMLYTDKVERMAFIIIQIVTITKNLSGLAVILNYAEVTFSKSESFLSPAEMSILLVMLFILVSAAAAHMSDFIGRRPLLLWSCFGCFVSNLLAGGYYFIHEKTNIDSSNYTWALYTGLSAYCIFINIGIGPLAQTLQAEMLGAGTRGVGAGFTIGFESFLSFFELKIYTPVNEMFGIYVNFLIYSLISLIGGILVFWLQYETAGKTIGQMEDRFKG